MKVGKSVRLVNPDEFWVLKDPHGLLHYHTMNRFKTDCWTYGGFNTVVDQQGDEWRMKYWKKEEASIKAALKLGYTFQRVRVVEINE